ncbi:MAG: ABC transporter permease [Planctomycetota bacterium]
MPHPFSKKEHLHPTAGRRANLLSVVTLAFLAVFVLVVLTLVVADVAYMVIGQVERGTVSKMLADSRAMAGIGRAIRLSVISSLLTLALVMLFSLPTGYALSRYRFPGHALVEVIVDVPIVLPPVVIGLSLLAMFGLGPGQWLKQALGLSLTSLAGIVLCQFLVSVSYCIRAMKASFDSADVRLEQVAMSLGCTPWQAFRRVTLPLSRSGLVAGGIIAWARALGVFGALMMLVGTGPRVRVMPTAMWLELNSGNIVESLTIAMASLVMAGAALAVVHWLAPGRTWT